MRLLAVRLDGLNWRGSLGTQQLGELSEHLREYAAGARGEAPDTDLAETILSAAQQVVLSSRRAQGHMASVSLTREIRCEIPEKAEVILEANFGLTSVESIDDGVRIDTFGIRVRPARGLVRPWFRLNRMDLIKDAMVIRDVPILKTFTIEVEQDKTRKIRCS
jgi:hypothetical protein